MTDAPVEKKPPTRTRNYLAGLTSGYVRTVVTVIVGLWLTPFTLRYLDRQEYAIFTLASDALMWLGLLDLGITTGLRVQAAQLTGRPDKEKLNLLASTAFFAQNGVVVLILIAGSVLAFLFPHLFPVRPDLQKDATNLMFMLVLGSSLSIGTQTFSAILVANQQIHIDNFIGLLNIGIRTLLTVVLLEAGWGLYSLAVAALAAVVVTVVLAVVRTYRFLPDLRIRWSLASWTSFKSISHVGLWFSLGGLAGIVIQSLDRIMTAQVVSIEMVTTLTLTGRLYALSGSLLGQITETARPMLGQIFGQRKMDHALRTYRRLFALSTGSAVVAAASMWAANGTFVTRWVGGTNYGGISLDFALALNLILASWILPNRAILTASLNVRPQVVCRMIEGGLNLGLSIVFGRMFGVFGVVFATAIACLVSSWWYMPLLTARMFGRPFRSFIWDDAARVIVLMACLFPIAYLLRQFAMGISGFVGAAFGIVATGLAGFILTWFLVFDAELRTRGLNAASGALSFIRPIPHIRKENNR
ncbi:MAG TPA: lipopolysaccharide biosynthesis protein [Bacteroidota bacterium]|nr:lipopolysaccharide biosynthesis protein [Bacteroidota bacterium]